MLGLAWKSLMWFLAGVAVALGFLLVPLQVAAERKKLDRTASEITRAHRDIRALETEFETRASLAQLDRWNADTLKLVAPAADQFLSDERALASLDVHGAGSGGAAVGMASFVPAAPADATAMGQPAPVTPAGAAPAAPVVRSPARTAMAAASPPALPSPPAAARAPRRDVALLDRALLDDSMIGDLRSGARAEISGARGTGR